MAEYRQWILAMFLTVLVANRRAGGEADEGSKQKKQVSRVVIFLKEQCKYEPHEYDRDEDHLGRLQDYMKMRNKTMPNNMEVSFLPRLSVCESETRGLYFLSALLFHLSSTNTTALIGSLEEDRCDVTLRLAYMWAKPFLTWSCPQATRGTQDLVPSLEETANAIVAVAKMLSWKSIVIITSDMGWWPALANKIEVGLQELGVAPRHIYWENDGHPKAALRGLQNTHARAIILCSSLRSPAGETMLQTIDNLKLSQSILLAIDVSSFIPFLPRTVTEVEKKSGLDENLYENVQSDAAHTSSVEYSNFSVYVNLSSSKNSSKNIFSNSTYNASESKNGSMFLRKIFHSGYNNDELYNADSALNNSINITDERLRIKRSNDDTLNKIYWSQDRYEMFENISAEMKNSLLILTSMDSKISSDFSNSSQQNEIFEHIIEGLEAVTDNVTDKMFKFVFLDWQQDDVRDDAADSRWRPLIVYESFKNSNVVKIQPNFDDWFLEKGLEYEEDGCDGDFCIRAQIKMNSTHIIIIVISAFLFCVLIIGIALILRSILLKKRLSKGPNKVVLTATDFVFPQVPDSRRVDEGIEAMLCCWLQQLQEFGGPEVDKPDLLKGSVGSLKGLGTAKGPSSNGSLAKNNYIVDHRIRYNGDLVQLKELPTVGTFELKGKAMDCLVLIQGLRHENLNPFIGCLTEPARPALVHEHCSRGSLEDVLMMDEIKLDWSFRLSLLTDLVRGMRYLHSTPIKVHGYLTSRNCVIDARWVLKITDYGLPAFYEAQSIPPSSKSARDLLWSAPELLRHCGLRRRGTQPGDVYSFGIIMQEVVVRGEPFCMLALSPEEIIEKVKKPPPLIRPSVSKGAAPPEAIHIMRQCWTEQPEMRPDFCQVHDLFRKLNHGRKVNFVDTMFQMLEKYSNNLEELIKERTEQLDMEKKKTEQLLNRMLPSYVAEKLKLGMPVDPEEFSEVSIYFSDIVGFTAISAHCTPFQVVDLLNDLYTCFDATINAYNVYKVETIGDAYMVVGGLPVRVPDHAEQVATMALDLLHQSGRFKIRHLPRTPLHLRIGLHTGPCCAGVVGLTMPRYCLFGDTVNTASRMESTGSAWRIHLSQATRDKLEAAGGYSLEYRGRTEVKGKGRLPTYWLLGKAGFDKALPSPPPLGLEESLAVNQSSAAQLGDNLEVISAQTSPGHSTSDEKASHHFSIDKSFFSVENSSSPKSENAKIKDALFNKGVSVDRKSPVILEPNKNEESTIGTTPTIENEETHKLAPISLGTPVSASEVAVALLSNSSNAIVTNRYKDVSKYKRSLMFETNDLSTPYNHYRCLSPSDSNINQLNQNKLLTSEGRQNSNRMLKRQFSLDRADDAGSAVPESNLATQNLPKTQARLCKQNSAGAATDLERIEEVPLAAVNLVSPRNYKRLLGATSTIHSVSKSVSNESLVGIDKR